MTRSRALRCVLTTGCAVAIVGSVLATAAPGYADDDIASSRPKRPAKRPPHRRKAAPKKKRAGADAGAKPAPTQDAGTPPSAPGSVHQDSGAAPLDEDDDDDPKTAPESDAAVAASPGTGEKKADDAEDTEDEDIDDDGWKYDVGAEADINSRLVWRGLAESRGAVLQPAAWVGLYGVTATAWTALDLAPEGKSGTFTPIATDISLSYVHTFNHLRLEPAFTFIDFSDRLYAGSTAEASLELAYEIGDFQLVSGADFDVIQEPGAYFGTGGASYTRSGRSWTIKAFANVGWATASYNFEYLGRDVAALDVVQGGVSTRYDIGEVLYVGLHADASTLVASRPTGMPSTLVVGGMTIGVDYSVGVR